MSHVNHLMRRRHWLLGGLSAALFPWTLARAHGPQGHGKDNALLGKGTTESEQMAWGVAGLASEVRRIVVIEMNDKMRFVPNRISVKLNETIRFEVRNRGKVLHEMVIGDEKTLREHAEMMKKHPGMEHDEPYMAHVDPGKKSELIWKFNRAGRFQFACLIPGHFEAGMIGTIEVNA